jgi:hypothetical protein
VKFDFLTRLGSHLDVAWITRARLSEELPNPSHYVSRTIGTLAFARTCRLHPRSAKVLKACFELQMRTSKRLNKGLLLFPVTDQSASARN